MNIGIKIRKIRELKGFSQDYMANQLCISQAAYSKLEKVNTLEKQKLEAVTQALEIPLNYVLSFDENKLLDEHINTPNNAETSAIISCKHYQNQLNHLEQEVLFLREQLSMVLKK